MENTPELLRGVEDLYLECIDPIIEYESRVTCQAWFVAMLHYIDPEQGCGEYTEIGDIAETELQETLDAILRDCAEQYDILRHTFDALAEHLPERALLLAASLNTLDRRNAAYLVSLDECVMLSYTRRIGKSFSRRSTA